MTRVGWVFLAAVGVGLVVVLSAEVAGKIEGFVTVTAFAGAANLAAVDWGLMTILGARLATGTADE